MKKKFKNWIKTEKLNFWYFEYNKNGILIGHMIKSPDEIRQALDHTILVLQSLSASKYVRAIKARVT